MRALHGENVISLRRTPGPRAWAFVLALASTACSAAPVSPAPLEHPAPPPPTGAHASAGPAPGPALCPAQLDVAELLARHARAFGNESSVAAALPQTVRMQAEIDGKTGSAEVVLDHARHRSELAIPGMHVASGIDEGGFWELGMPGVVTRLRPDEAVSIAFEAWLLRRSYLSTFDPRRDAATCRVQDGAPRASLRYEMPLLGTPVLDLDLGTAALLSASAADTDGSRSTTRFEAWTPADAHGLRWPAASVSVDALGNEQKQRLVESAPGLACKEGAACLSPPTPALAFAWPASGLVHIPMKHYLGELSLRVKLGGREVWALLDSGAGLSAIDATTPAGASFVPSLELRGSGASQAVSLGLGELPTLRVGDLVLSHVPAVSVPIPPLADFGNRRPEVILGYSFFLGATVRVDYARSEIVLGRRAEALVRPGATAVPFRVLGAKWVADVQVDGVTGPFQIDTGNAGGIDMVKRWADAHGFPGSRKTLSLRGRTGAGVGETTSVLFRVEKTSLGPIHHDGEVVHMEDPPGENLVAGLVGNDVLSHCAAVVFDVERRTMWLEGPCDRARPASLGGFRLTRREDPKQKDRPWEIATVVPGGSAERAGLLPGDRLLDIGGVTAGEDISQVLAVTEKPAGTKVVVSYERKGKREKATMTLSPVLAP